MRPVLNWSRGRVLAAVLPLFPVATPADERRGDLYVDASLGDASFLNPILAADSASGAIVNLVFNGLVKYDRDLRLTGDLASSWEVHDGGRRIVFHVRDNVRWHDGVPFTSSDVVFTWRTLTDPSVRTPFSSDFTLVKDCIAPDRRTVVVTYREPFAPALESWGIGMLPAHIFGAPGTDFHGHPANRAPVGTGPYRFVSWKPDEKIELSANDDYFEGRPFFDRYIFRIIPDQSVQFLELLNGGIDSMNLTPDQSRAYDEFFRNYQRFSYPSFSYTYLGFNLNKKIFAQRAVRVAIAHAIDKQALIAGVLLDKGRSATGPFPPQSWAHDPEIVDFRYDPDLARRILAGDGWVDTDGDGIVEKMFGIQRTKLAFTLLTNQGNMVRRIAAEIIQSQLRAVGIEVEVRILEWSVFINNFVDTRAFDAVVLGWNLSRDPDQYVIWHSSQTGPGRYNFTGYSNPEVDRLLEEGRREFDQTRRQLIYRRLHRLIHDDVPYVFLYYPDAMPVVHKRIRGVELTKAGIGWNFIRWYVPRELRKYQVSPD